MYSNIEIPRSPYASEEHQLLKKSLDTFFQKEAIPFYEQWEKEKRVPRSFWRKMGEQGYLCMDVPEDYGGAALDYTYSALVMERARYWGIDFGVGVHSDIVAPYIVNYGTEAQKLKYLPKMVSGECIASIGMTEPSVGSDLKALKTTAKDMGDHYLINGSKTFITNGTVAHFVICACRTNAGTPQEGISLIFIDKDTPGFTHGQPFEKIGLKASDTCELFFEDVKVPKSNLLGEEGMGFKYMMTELARERVCMAVEAIGAVAGVLDKTVEYVTERRMFKKSLAEFQNTQFKLADCAAELQVYQSFTDTCIQLQAAHKLTPIQASIAKLKASEMQGKVIDECLQLFGGYGFIWEYPVARAYASARVTRIYAGASEIMKLIISRGLFSEFYHAKKKKKQLLATTAQA